MGRYVFYYTDGSLEDKELTAKEAELYAFLSGDHLLEYTLYEDEEDEES